MSPKDTCLLLFVLYWLYRRWYKYLTTATTKSLHNHEFVLREQRDMRDILHQVYMSEVVNLYGDDCDTSFGHVKTRK